VRLAKTRPVKVEGKRKAKSVEDEPNGRMIPPETPSSSKAIQSRHRRIVEKEKFAGM
jgi:hypothetical protein